MGLFQVVGERISMFSPHFGLSLVSGLKTWGRGDVEIWRPGVQVPGHSRSEAADQVPGYSRFEAANQGARLFRADPIDLARSGMNYTW